MVKQQGQTPNAPKRKRKGRGGQASNVQVQTMAMPVGFGTSMTSRAQPPDEGNFKMKLRMEYVGDIIGSTAAFSLQTTYSVNPGVSSSFPWLSAIANNYDMYRFTRLAICYMNKTGSDNKGEVNIVFDPDPTDQPPANDLEALNYQTRITTNPWMNAKVEVPRADLNRLPKFMVRSSGVASDVTTFDVGQLHVICGGNTAAVKIGQLWLEYEIEFFAPQVRGSGGASSRSTTVQVPNGTTALPNAGTTAIPFLTTVFNPLGATITLAGGITGLSGTFVFYTQQIISAATLTNGNLLIRKNGVIVLNAPYPPLLNGLATMNAETVLQLIPSDVVDIAVSATGTTLVAQGVGSAILVINPA